jgi:hypothetical protein
VDECIARSGLSYAQTAREGPVLQDAGRPLIKWAYMMFYRRAILDGAAGLMYSTL